MRSDFSKKQLSGNVKQPPAVPVIAFRFSSDIIPPLIFAMWSKIVKFGLNLAFRGAVVSKRSNACEIETLVGIASVSVFFHKFNVSRF